MLSDELAKLQALHQAGALSDHEYTAAKAQLLRQPQSQFQPDHPDRETLGGMTPNTYAMVLHLSHYAGYLVPFAGFIIPIGMWLYAKDQNNFIHEQGRSSANFILSYFIYYSVYGLIAIFFYFLIIQRFIFHHSSEPFLFPWLFILFIPMIPLIILDVISPIFGAIAASQGNSFRYPLTLTIF